MIIVTKGGAGSGNFQHAGRPGKIGGSAPSGISRINVHDEDAVARRKVRKHVRSNLLKRVAKNLGVDIKITYSDQVKRFTLGGNRYRVGGEYRANEKRIIIFNIDDAGDEAKLSRMVAHEYSHHKFRTVVPLFVTTQTVLTPEQTKFKADLMSDEENILGMSQSGKEVSSYAGKHWSVYESNRYGDSNESLLLLAVNETLAEVANRKYRSSEQVNNPSQEWIDLYNEMDRIYHNLTDK